MACGNALSHVIKKTYDNEEQVRRMVKEQKDMKIPTELILTVLDVAN